jgi:hypothetical protein
MPLPANSYIEFSQTRDSQADPVVYRSRKLSAKTASSAVAQSRGEQDHAESEPNKNEQREKNERTR